MMNPRWWTSCDGYLVMQGMKPLAPLMAWADCGNSSFSIPTSPSLTLDNLLVPNPDELVEHAHPAEKDDLFVGLMLTFATSGGSFGNHNRDNTKKVPNT